MFAWPRYYEVRIEIPPSKGNKTVAFRIIFGVPWNCLYGFNKTDRLWLRAFRCPTGISCAMLKP